MDKTRLRKKVRHWFGSHVPTEKQKVQMEKIRVSGLKLAETIVEATPDGPDQSNALRKVREAVATAQAAVLLTPES